MFSFVKHLLVPHSGNNHRAKILHHSSLLVIIFVLFLLTYLGNALSKNYPEILGISYSVSEPELLTLVNEQRQERGLAPLAQNPKLDDAARRKAADMFAKNYWAHFSPDGSSSPWGFISAAGYSYRYAGENLAKGFTDSSSAVSAWMASPTHRDNILSDKYTEVGFAIVPGTLQGEETVLIVEMFGSTGVAQAPQAPTQIAQAESPQQQNTQVAAEQTENEEEVIPTQPLEQVQQTDQGVKEDKAENLPIIDTKITTRTATSVGLTFLMFGFIMDMIIVERNKIPRIVGHNLDHIILIVMFVIFLVIMEGGVVI